jgi:pimeloyl-ACP methyl ester carboxylesterase
LYSLLGQFPEVASQMLSRYIQTVTVCALLLCSCSQVKSTPTPRIDPAGPTSASSPDEQVESTQTEYTKATTTTPAESSTPFVPSFEPGECRFRRPVWSTVECGDLIVLENRSSATSSIIRLHVTILRSSSENPEPDPLIYLSGGPGSFALDWLVWETDLYHDILGSRDVIVFDQRGIGYSEPNMDCPEVSEEFNDTLDQNLSAEEWVQGKVRANLACRERLANEGIDLSAYNSAAIAADVNDLRLVLGYDTVNLLGLSYGTRLALTVMRDFPDTVRSAILDSAVPLQMDAFAAQGSHAQRSLDMVFDYCAADEDCSGAFPDLEGVFNGLLERLASDPIKVNVAHLFTGQLSEMLVNDNIFVAGVFEALYDPDSIALIPKMIYGTYHELPGYNYQLSKFMEIHLLWHDFSSEGMRYSVLCSEEAPFSSLQDALEENAGLNPGLRAFMDIDIRTDLLTCDGWGVDALASVENAAVHSDIPTLVLTGDFDPVTPPMWGDAVLETMGNGTHVVFPYWSHGVFFDRRCPGDVTASFLDNPYSDPDMTCVDSVRRYPLEFVTN